MGAACWLLPLGKAPPQGVNKAERGQKGHSVLVAYPLKLQALGKLTFYRHIAHVAQKVEKSFVFLRGKVDFEGDPFPQAQN